MKSNILPAPPRNIMSASCSTCGDRIFHDIWIVPSPNSMSKRCKECCVVLLTSGGLGRTSWYPVGTIPGDDSERLK